MKFYHHLLAPFSFQTWLTFIFIAQRSYVLKDVLTAWSVQYLYGVPTDFHCMDLYFVFDVFTGETLFKGE